MNQPLWIVPCLVGLLAASCAKKEPKPRRTEPWLAHGSSSAAARGSGDRAPPLEVRYTLDEQSRIRVELPGRHGSLHGVLSHVTGELRLNLAALSQSRGLVRADLDSLSLHGTDGERDAELAARVRRALDLSDTSAPSRFASFELTALEDVSPAELEPAKERDAGAPFTRRVLSTAVGDLLLHGFRVVRRAPLTAEFSFVADRQVPNSVVIRSRAPFVISLETHAIRVPEGELRVAGRGASPASGRDAHVSIELYLKKEQ